MGDRLLTVEIHDVSPATLEEVSEIRAELTGIGIDRTNLLVVPNYLDEGGHAWDLRDYARAVDLLLCEQENGSEIIQHGHTHRAPGPPPPGLRNAFMHHVFSRGCAEFAHLPARQARVRIEAGRRILTECGLKIRGFIAPAWQQSIATTAQLAMLGYSFTATLGHILPLGGKQPPVRTPALTFDAQCKLVDFGKRAVMRGLEYLSRPAAVLRVALHPGDLYGGFCRAHWHKARPLDYILGRIRALMRHRRVVTYSEWLS